MLNEQILNLFSWEPLCWGLKEKGLVNFTHGDIGFLRDPKGFAIGKTFLEALMTSKPRFTTRDLLNVAEENERGDICQILENTPDVILSELDHDTRCRLCIIGRHSHCCNDWKTIAESCSFNDDQIRNIESAGNRLCMQRFSTEELFILLRTRTPDLTLSALCSVMRERKLVEAAQTLQTIIDGKRGKKTHKRNLPPR